LPTRFIAAPLYFLSSAKRFNSSEHRLTEEQAWMFADLPEEVS